MGGDDASFRLRRRRLALSLARRTGQSLAGRRSYAGALPVAAAGRFSDADVADHLSILVSFFVQHCPPLSFVRNNFRPPVVSIQLPSSRVYLQNIQTLSHFTEQLYPEEDCSSSPSSSRVIQATVAASSLMNSSGGGSAAHDHDHLIASILNLSTVHCK